VAKLIFSLASLVPWVVFSVLIGRTLQLGGEARVRLRRDRRGEMAVDL
jgi:hypothetical protein